MGFNSGFKALTHGYRQKQKDAFWVNEASSAHKVCTD